MVVLAVALVGAGAAHASLDRAIVGAEQDHALAAVSTTVSCEDTFNQAFTMQPHQVGDQSQVEFELDGVEELKITAAQYGGIAVRGWSHPHARMVVCRYAAAGDAAQAARVLRSIDVRYDSGVVRTRGPVIDARQTWWVNVTLFVPSRTAVDLTTESGAVAVRNLRARVRASSQSGGISIVRSSGEHTIRTVSGGITIDRVSGPVEATSSDGSIALKLETSDAPSLEAKTSESGQILCIIDRCNGALEAMRRTSLRLGSNKPRVKLSTGSGSIHISSVKS